MAEGRYLIHKSSFGLGHMFRELGAAALYAQLSGRKLVIDWRNTAYFGFEPSENIYPHVIKRAGKGRQRVDIVTVTDELQEVQDTNSRTFPDIRWCEWSPETEAELYQIIRDSVGAQIIPILNDMAKGRKADPFEDYDFVWGAREFCGYARLRKWDAQSRMRLREFFQDVEFVDPIHRLADEFIQREITGQNVIGVHVRHGNGEQGDFVAKGRVISDDEAYVDGLLHRLNQWGKAAFEGSFRILVCTDAPIIRDMFATKCRHSIHRQQWLPEANAGGTTVMDGNRGANTIEVPNPVGVLHDTVADMLVLSHCRVLDLSSRSAFNYLPALLQIEGGQCHMRANEDRPQYWSSRISIAPHST